MFRHLPGVMLVGAFLHYGSEHAPGMPLGRSRRGRGFPVIESQRGVLSWFSMVKFEFGIKKKVCQGVGGLRVWNRFRQPLTQNTSFQIGLGVSDP
jgi:hypothetical protein